MESIYLYYEINDTPYIFKPLLLSCDYKLQNPGSSCKQSQVCSSSSRCVACGRSIASLKKFSSSCKIQSSPNLNLSNFFTSSLFSTFTLLVNGSSETSPTAWTLYPRLANVVNDFEGSSMLQWISVFNVIFSLLFFQSVQIS